MKTSRSPRGKRTTKAMTDFSFSSDRPPFAKKDEYIAESVTFAIHAVELDVGGGFAPGENRWKVEVVRDDNGVREIITLPSNAKRDAQLRAAAEHIAANGPIPNLRLVKLKNALYFRAADSRGT